MTILNTMNKMIKLISLILVGMPLVQFTYCKSHHSQFISSNRIDSIKTTDEIESLISEIDTNYKAFTVNEKLIFLNSYSKLLFFK